MRSDTQGADIFMFYRHYNSCGGGGISFLFEFFYYPRVITEHKHPTHRHAQKDKHIKTKEWELTSTTSLDLSHYAQQRAALDWQGQARGPASCSRALQTSSKLPQTSRERLWYIYSTVLIYNISGSQTV